MNGEDIKKVQAVSSVLNQMQNIARPYAVAIAGLNTSNEGEVVGTGTIIEFGGKVLLTTAEHVISRIETKKYVGTAFSNGDGKLYTKTLVKFTTNKDIDVACLRIPRPQEPDSDRLACPERLIAKTAGASEKDLLFIYGFPGDDSEYWALLKGVRSKTFTFAAYSGISKDPSFNLQNHFAIRFEPKHCIGIEGSSADLPIPPHGLSGTVVWIIPRVEQAGTWVPEEARIVGIVQKWDQESQCLIATRIEHLLPFFREIQ